MLRLIWKEVQWDHCPLIRDQDFSFLEARSGQKTSSTVPLKFSIFSFSFLKSRHHSFGVRNVPYLWRIWLSKIVFSCSPFFQWRFQFSKAFSADFSAGDDYRFLTGDLCFLQKFALSNIIFNWYHLGLHKNRGCPDFWSVKWTEWLF